MERRPGLQLEMASVPISSKRRLADSHMWEEYRLAGDADSAAGRFYLRINVEDRPGVMAEVASVLGRHGISIASVVQHEPSGQDSEIVPLVIMTHESTEGAARLACEEIDQLTTVRPSTVRLRVAD